MGPPSLITSGDIFANTLRECGIDTVFGVPGTQNLQLYESLRRAKIKCILATTETSATFMANGYYRASGNLCATVSIPGPGLTYALAGLAEARQDSAAVLHVMQISPSRDTKVFQFQELDLRRLAEPMVKEYVEIEDPADIAGKIHHVCRAALSGEPGPVVLTVTTPALTRPAKDIAPHKPSTATPATDFQIEHVAEMVSNSKKVAIFAGQGAINGSAELLELATTLNAPVVTTSAGRGVIPESHPLSIDLDFTLGAVPYINDLFAECDLILALGCKFSHNGTAGFRLNFGQAKLVHVDTSEEVLTSGNYQPEIRVQADGRSFLGHLIDQCKNLTIPGFDKANLVDRKSRLTSVKRKQIYCEPRIHGHADGRFETFFNRLNEQLDKRTMIVTDAGLHQTITRVYSRIEYPRQLITPSDFQSTGYGIPAGIGAATARPDKRVIIITGDGSFAIHAMELREAVRQNYDLGVIVFNDAALGSIRMQQLNAFGRETAVAVPNMDYATLARALQVRYFSLTDGSDTLVEFMRADGVRLLEVRLADSPELAGLRRRAKLREQISRSPLAPALKSLRKWLLGR